jgi:hypothetical protein
LVDGQNPVNKFHKKSQCGKKESPKIEKPCRVQDFAAIHSMTHVPTGRIVMIGIAMEYIYIIS